MKIISETINGELEAVLIDDDGERLQVLDKKYDADGNPIEVIVPEWALAKIKRDYERGITDSVGNKLDKDGKDDEDDVPEVNPQFVVEMNRRAMGTAEPKKPVLIEANDPKARYPRPPKPKKPSMFLQPPQKEKYTDPRRVKVPPSIVKQFREIEDIDSFTDEVAHRVIERLSDKNKKSVLRKGFLSTLLGIGAIASMLPNKEQDRLERLAEKEMERAERMRDKNNRRLNRRR